LGSLKTQIQNSKNQKGIAECNYKSFKVKGPFAAKHKLKTLKMKKLLQSHDLALTFENT
jgi:hypothetical protein